MTAQPESQWYESQARLTRFADALVASGRLTQAGEVTQFFASPWKFDAEYFVWIANGAPFPDFEQEADDWNRFVEALSALDLISEFGHREV